MHILVIPTQPDTEPLHHPIRYPHATFQSINTDPQVSNHYVDFYHYRLLLPALERQSTELAHTQLTPL